jgi:spore germination protein GerM
MDGDRAVLVPETRQVRPDGSIYTESLRELVKGPAGEGLYPTLPSGTTVNSVTLSDGLATADFGIGIISEFEEIPHSSTTETLAIYSIVNTLTGFEDIEQVKITIEGKESGKVDGFYVEDFWGHIGIYEIFERNDGIIKDE